MWRWIFVAAALLSSGCSKTAAPASDPVAVIEALYLPDPAPDAIPWTPDLAALVQKDAATPSGAVRAIDFNPLTGGQDDTLTELHVAVAAPPANGAAEVVARFRNFDQPTEIHFDLKAANGGWRVDNIRAPGATGWDVRKLLTAGPSPRANGAATDKAVECVGYLSLARAAIAKGAGTGDDAAMTRAIAAWEAFALKGLTQDAYVQYRVSTIAALDHEAPDRILAQADHCVTDAPPTTG